MGRLSLGTVKIKRGIFQGDLPPLFTTTTLCDCSHSVTASIAEDEIRVACRIRRVHTTVNHLLFMDDLRFYGKTEKELNRLVSPTRIFSNDIKMESRIAKCCVLVIKEGKVCKRP